MRKPFETTVEALAVPPLAWREAALARPHTADEHAALIGEPEAASLHAIQRGAGTRPSDAPLTIAAWNVERGTHVDEIGRTLRDAHPSIVLLSEVDLGMARSGNRDTGSEIAAALGMEHLFAVEFIELGLGDEREAELAAGARNEAGLHGNAVLSRLPIRRALAVPLDDGGRWFVDPPDPNQRRIGGRIVVAALVETPQGPLWAASIHLESHSDPADRAAQAGRALDALLAVAGETPIVVGGDLNTKECTGGLIATDGLQAAYREEPLFHAAAERGFIVDGANTAATTSRRRAWHREAAEPRKLDWFLTHGAAPSRPQVRPALDAAGAAISDHELILVDVALR